MNDFDFDGYFDGEDSLDDGYDRDEYDGGFEDFDPDTGRYGSDEYDPEEVS